MSGNFREKSDPGGVDEYKVGPLPSITSHVRITEPSWKRNIPANYRNSYSGLHVAKIDALFNREMPRINHILQQVTGYRYGNCTNNCLRFEIGMPAQWTSPDRKSLYLVLFRDVEGHYLHPIGMQLRVDMTSLNLDEWTIDLLWFRGVVYLGGIDDFLANFDMTPYENTEPYTVSDDRNLYSTLNFRGDPLPREPKRGPRSYMPDGKRFSVNRHQVSWQGWRFDFNVRSDIGLQIHDARFKGDRIAYELSMSELGVIYSGASPSPQHTSFLDATFGLGALLLELFPEVDCPEDAQYFDFVHYYEGNIMMNRRAICLFEMNQGVPLRRMYASDHKGSYVYFQGMPSNVLVLRGIISLGNYDYIMDYIFHQNGMIEVKASLDGYIASTYYTEEEGDRFGFQV